jgi:hypothetical protein
MSNYTSVTKFVTQFQFQNCIDWKGEFHHKLCGFFATIRSKIPILLGPEAQKILTLRLASPAKK